MSAPRVALVHDWLTGMRGGEYVLEAIAGLFRTCEIFSLIHVRGSVSPALESHPIHVSALQRLPGIERRYRHFLPVMPRVIERFDLSGFDLVISSSHCVAKGVRKRGDAVHVSYVHAPMRYMWNRFDDYFGPGRASLPVRIAARAVRPFLQGWDRRVSQPDRVDALVANSRFVGGQISQAYGREARVIHPFADLRRFAGERRPGPKYLMVGAFAPNKRVDLAIQAFNELRLPLQIVGGGQDERALRAMAGPQTEFLGLVSNEMIARLMLECRAFVFPGIEDFGITPIEANAAGAPVIAYAEGGVLETVTEKTGVFFQSQTVAALKAAVLEFESGRPTIQASDCRERAGQFTRDRFQRELRETIRETWRVRGRNPAELDQALS